MSRGGGTRIVNVLQDLTVTASVSAILAHPRATHCPALMPFGRFEIFDCYGRFVVMNIYNVVLPNMPCCILKSTNPCNPSRVCKWILIGSLLYDLARQHVYTPCCVL
jgi:hypothetical protein